MNTIERKMHQHNIESDNMDRDMKKQVKELDDDVEKAKAQSKVELKNALSRKEQLQKELEGQTDNEARQRLLKELGDIEGSIVKLMNEEA